MPTVLRPYRFSILCGFCIFLFLFAQKAGAQAIPKNLPTPICDGQSISTGAPVQSDYNTISIPCGAGLDYLSPYLDFYRILIQSGSTFTFEVTPDGSVDYDFGAWLNPDWDDLSATPYQDTRGSQNDPFQTNQFSLGLSLTATDLCEAPGSSGIPEPGKVRYFDVQPGDEILIALDRWDQTDLGYTINFGGDAVLDCTILGTSYYQCDDDGDHTEEFEKSELLADLQMEYPDGNFEFYNANSGAQSGEENPIDFPLEVHYNDGDPKVVYVRVEDDAGSFIKVVKIRLYVAKLPEILEGIFDLPKRCEEDQQGRAVYDLTLYDSQLNPNNPDSTRVVYYADYSAYTNNQPIDDPTQVSLADGQLVWADVVNTVTQCHSLDYVQVRGRISEIPEVDLSAYAGTVICAGDSLRMDSGFPAENYRFTWKRNDSLLTEEGPTLQITQEGNYEVSVANALNPACRSSDKVIIGEHGPPDFQVRPIHPGLGGGKGIMVFGISGKGHYFFSLDNGPWQSADGSDKLKFTGLTSGEHIIRGKDFGGCGSKSVSILLLGYPKFFTPNGDGVHDTWNIPDLKNQPKAQIYIFDRYGKLLAHIHPNGSGWDGRFHGKALPRNDYWFKVEYQVLSSKDGQGQPAVYTGHFTLIR